MDFHHVGIAVGNLERAIENYRKLNYVEESDVFVDPIQNVKGIFMTNGSFRIELLEGLNEKSPTSSFLKRGIAMYHQGYIVEKIHQVIEQLVSDGALLLNPPAEAVAFGGRKIAFLFLRNRQLIEVIEREDVYGNSLI